MNELFLVLNAGSSSLKFSLYLEPDKKEIVNGNIEKIGNPDSTLTIKYGNQKISNELPISDHEVAIKAVFSTLLKYKFINKTSDIKAVGHRVLHGGEKYNKSVLIDENVIEDIQKLSKLGPLHHPAQLSIIKKLNLVLGVPQIAVFDTAFHQTIPKINYLYPVPMEWYEKYSVRKYGFHGTSHKYITEQKQKQLNKKDVNLIICHVGNGASISCIKNGECYDTTMGLTPLDGLMMGTRSGSIDPSIIQYIMKETGKNIDDVSNDLNTVSGFKGICGNSDCRDVEELAMKGDANSILALDMYSDRIVNSIVTYYSKLMGKVDSIIFTAGLLENSILMRKMIMEKLSWLGITLDEEKNHEIAKYKNIHEGIISGKESKTIVEVFPTNEEIQILNDTYEIYLNLKKDELKENKLVIK